MYKTVHFNIFEEHLEDVVYKNEPNPQQAHPKPKDENQEQKPIFGKIRNRLSKVFKGAKTSK
ncbi:hypothetical protein BH10ACI1_BH10ACI1_32140 [soil metagenome]